MNYSSARGYQQSALAQTMENLPLNSNFPVYNWLLNKRLNHVNFQRQKTKPEEGKGF
ncbi:hypothetical protein D020_3114 [Vibrio parahaemolyticus SBR10290]|nr:hypothetical protein D021_2273 [Vibrio parahaemolyticus 10296]ESW44260.1 hypothetical protein D022_2222 [Vibrio parahaemolyticus 12310]ETT20706.1 hypothetical protein D023_2405 [Vibrio parahaemolyticus 3256]ETX53341.1 hypothetical protein D020_3114 [Vibrio parahaemolyticus SBR10290]